MRRKTDTGIQVTTHVVKETKTKNKKSLFSVIYQIIFLLLAAYGTIFSGVTGIEISVNESVLITVIGLAGIAFSLSFMFIKKVHYIVMAVFAGTVGVAIYYLNSVVDGLKRIYNIFIVSYNSYYNAEVKPIRLEGITTPRNITLCICMFSVLLVMLIAYCLLRSHQAIYYLFITIPFIFIPYLVGLLPKPGPFYCYIIATFVMLTPILAFGKGSVRNSEIKFRLTIIMTVLTLSVFIIGYIQITPKRYQTMNVGALKKSVQTSVQSYSVNSIFQTNPLQILLTKSHSAGGGMSGGTLGENSSLKFSNKTMLEVKLGNIKSTPFYIKGYVGQVYDHNEWNGLEGKDRDDFDLLNKEYKSKGFNAESISQKYLERSPRTATNGNISIKNVGNSTSASFVPYNASTECMIGDNGYLKWNGAELGYLEYQTMFMRPNFYVPGTVGSASAQSAMERNLVASNLLTSAMRKYMLESTFGQSIEVISQETGQYENLLDNVDDQIMDMPAIREWTNKHEELKDSIDFSQQNLSEVLSNIIKLSDYMEFEAKAEKLIYRAYTKLPDDSLARVKKLVHGWYKPSRVLLNTHDDTLNYAFHQFDQYDRYSAYVKAIAKVKNYLASHTKYTLNPGELPKGEDFVEEFLFEKKKGYCMHYASAATVMFRAMGIPARYVEGYIVTASDINNCNKKTGVISIKDKNAHAWTEIYMDGYGWMPVEATTAYERDHGKTIPAEITRSLEKKTGNKKNAGSKPTACPKVKPTKNPISNKVNSKNSGTHKKNSVFNVNLPNWAIYVIKRVALFVITISLVLFIISLRIFIIQRMRKKSARNGDNSRRLLAQYYLFEKTMKEYQIHYGSTTSFDTLYQQCAAIFPEIEENDLKRYINLALKAKYDQGRVSREEIVNADSLYRKFMKQIGSGSRRSKRLFLRYIKVLEV